MILYPKQNNLGFSHIMIFVDFNYPSINWNDITSPPGGNHQSALFLEAVRDSFLWQHVTEPIHYKGHCPPNTLDLIFNNEEGMVKSLKYLAPVGKNHHTFLKFNFCCYTKSHTKRTNKFKYDKGDYDTMHTD